MESYNMSKITPVGSVESQLYYFGLTAIAIDLFNYFYTEK